jgi:predicted AAA+ superfamily ATPase
MNLEGEAVTIYHLRVVDSLLDQLLPHLPAVALEGPKGVGKTATARRRAKSTISLETDDGVALLRADPGLIDTLPGPVLVDEWHRYPHALELVRQSVDRGATAGRFLLTGSTAPRGARIHSGAGRITGLRVRPFSLLERGVSSGTVSLSALLSGNAQIAGNTNVQLGDYASEIESSGLPAIRAVGLPRARRAQLDAYIDYIIRREFAAQGYPVRNPVALRAWLAAYAAASSTTTKYSEILDAATPNQGAKPAKTTTMVYREALDALWLLDPTPAWLPQTNPLGQLGQASNHQLADPGLACRLLNLDHAALMSGQPGSMLGALFESLVTLDVTVYAQLAEARVFHFRQKDGRHEADLIVEALGGRVVAIEVKLANTPDDADARHLLWLKSNLGNRLADMAIINTGPRAYRRPDGVAVIPAALLGP